MKLQVLIATMQQRDLSIINKMNIRRDVIITNQCGKWEYKEDVLDNQKALMLSSDTKGVGINRNMALQLATADILLFSDDDVTYYDDSLQGVEDAFKEIPDADVIFFGLDMTQNGEIYKRFRDKKMRRHVWNSLRYGAPRMAVRRSAVMENRLAFSTLFGGGCKYGSGEDSLFICDCFRSGLKVYSHPYVVGTCAQDSSTWFSGYNEKFMFDRGAFVEAAFPKFKHIIFFYYLWKDCRRSSLSLKECNYYMNSGMKAYGKQQSFEEYFLSKVSSSDLAY